ncbi:MAG TPA: Fe-S protein assembly co-chaperone HscB [Chitinophagaceae bacterium]|nr:Fe-S protein assembly co-chaperone HscB [Chitinophagaceae bacterium]
MVDGAALSAKYFELSRRYHPDYFVNSSPEQQSEALERSALLNKAIRTFQHPDETIRYVLQLKGLLEDEEKYQLPPEFLMEVLEINEELMDPESADLRSIRARIDELQAEIYESVRDVVENYREGDSEAGLLRVKEYYYKKKYLDRIRMQLSS